MPLTDNPNALAHYPLDRAGRRRKDGAWLQAAIDEDHALVAAFSRGRIFLYESDGALFIRYLAGHVYARIGDPKLPLIFLGVDRDEAPHFACEIAHPEEIATLGQFRELRAAAPLLQQKELPIIGCARALIEWHGRNLFCPACGGATEAVEAGWMRCCAACAAEHYPRVDPVAIMLPVIGDKCLLGRQRAWPPGMHSALAGYIEPGETIEEAAARETLEEAGLRAVRVRAHSNQPWPFPYSLMIGLICEVADDQEKVDTSELESARWFTRAEARQLLAGAHPDCFCPPPFAIAHQLLKSWAEEGEGKA